MFWALAHSHVCVFWIHFSFGGIFLKSSLRLDITIHNIRSDYLTAAYTTTENVFSCISRDKATISPHASEDLLSNSTTFLKDTEITTIRVYTVCTEPLLSGIWVRMSSSNRQNPAVEVIINREHPHVCCHKVFSLTSIHRSNRHLNCLMCQYNHRDILNGTSYANEAIT